MTNVPCILEPPLLYHAVSAQPSPIVAMHNLESARKSVTSPQTVAHLAAEVELPNAAALVVVPDHHFVGRVLRVSAAADDGQDVAAVEHLHDANAIVEVSPTKVESMRKNIRRGRPFKCYRDLQPLLHS